MSSKILFTFVSSISSILTITVSTVFFIVLLRHIHRERDVSLLLIMNTYMSMIVFGCVVLSSTVNVLQADLFGMKNLTESELVGCRFRGFMIYETFGCFNMTFVLQAIFRLTRVIYAKYRFLQVCFVVLIIIIEYSIQILDIRIEYVFNLLSMDCILSYYTSVLFLAGTTFCILRE